MLLLVEIIIEELLFYLEGKIKWGLVMRLSIFNLLLILNGAVAR
jgi:hypothetical protein